MEVVELYNYTVYAMRGRTRIAAIEVVELSNVHDTRIWTQSDTVGKHRGSRNIVGTCTITFNALLTVHLHNLRLIKHILRNYTTVLWEECLHDVYMHRSDAITY